MFDFDEIMRQAQNGAASENLAKAFNLTQQQTQAALQMMLPAMAEGFRRNAQNMNAMATMFESMGTGPYAKYFQNPAEAFGAAARGDGNDVLGQIFGSKEMSRAIADQTAAFAGIGSDIVRKMLPLVASILMGGMTRQAQSGNPFEAMLKQMTGGTGMASGSGGGNPFTQMYEDFMKQLGANAGQKSADPEKADAPAFGKELQDLWQEMFRTGRRVQDAQAEALGRVFDEFTGRGGKGE